MPENINRQHVGFPAGTQKQFPDHMYLPSQVPSSCNAVADHNLCWKRRELLRAIDDNMQVYIESGTVDTYSQAGTPPHLIVIPAKTPCIKLSDPLMVRYRAYLIFTCPSSNLVDPQPWDGLFITSVHQSMGHNEMVAGHERKGGVLGFNSLSATVQIAWETYLLQSRNHDRNTGNFPVT